MKTPEEIWDVFVAWKDDKLAPYKKALEDARRRETVANMERDAAFAAYCKNMANPRTLYNTRKAAIAAQKKRIAAEALYDYKFTEFSMDAFLKEFEVEP